MFPLVFWLLQIQFVHLVVLRGDGRCLPAPHPGGGRRDRPTVLPNTNKTRRTSARWYGGANICLQDLPGGRCEWNIPGKVRCWQLTDISNVPALKITNGFNFILNMQLLSSNTFDALGTEVVLETEQIAKYWDFIYRPAYVACWSVVLPSVKIQWESNNIWRLLHWLGILLCPTYN